MTIAKVETFILHVPVTRGGIADSTHSITHWSAPGVRIETDTGLVGYGYTGTHANLPLDRLITSCIDEVYVPLLVGQDTDPAENWRRLLHHPPAQWVGRAGITHLALAAVDVALWDITAKAAGMPLWSYLAAAGDDRPPKTIEVYNTDGGWLNWSISELVADCKRLGQDEGYPGVKIKIGDDIDDAVARVDAVRTAIGDAKLMVDANGRYDLATAKRVGARLADYDVVWFEEPMWYDDLASHKELAKAIKTPIALGEQLYTFDHFRTFIDAGTVHYVQADCVRLAGITEWLRVANYAHEKGLPVVPHVGDMAQVHLHLAIAHPACTMLEYIPWMKDCFVEPVQVRDGKFVAPALNGAATTLREDATERYGVR